MKIENSPKLKRNKIFCTGTIIMLFLAIIVIEIPSYAKADLEGWSDDINISNDPD